MTSTFLIAGTTIWTRSSGAGRIGLLACDEDGKVYALTVSTILASGNKAAIQIGAMRRSLALGNLPFGGDNEGSFGIAAMEVPPEIPVQANVAGVANAGMEIEPVEALGCDLYVQFGDAHCQCRISGLGAALGIQNNGHLTDVGAFLELKVASGSAIPSSGDAGSLVTTRDSRPLALVIGMAESQIIAVPIVSFLSSNRLRILDTHGAARHNSLAEIVKLRPQPTQSPMLAASDLASSSSDQLFKKYDPEAILRELEAA